MNIAKLNFYCFLTKISRTAEELSKPIQPIDDSSKPKSSVETTGQSMFIKQRDFAYPSTSKGFDNSNKIDFGMNSEAFNDNFEGPTSHAIYRTNYPSYLDYKNTNESDFFKSLEDKARTNQRATITRPHSIFTESSFSLPTAYYEQTTPYAEFNGRQFKKYQLEMMQSAPPPPPPGNETINEEQEDDDDALGDDEINVEDDDSNTFGFESENEPEMNEIIEAFNPNVQVINIINLFNIHFNYVLKLLL